MGNDCWFYVCLILFSCLCLFIYGLLPWSKVRVSDESEFLRWHIKLEIFKYVDDSGVNFHLLPLIKHIIYFRNRRVKNHKSCWCLLFFLDVNISQHCSFQDVINHCLNVNKVPWAHALAVCKRVWSDESKANFKQSIPTQENQFQKAMQGQRMILAFAKRAFHFISRNAKHLYHPSPFSLTAQMLWLTWIRLVMFLRTQASCWFHVLHGEETAFSRLIHA